MTAKSRAVTFIASVDVLDFLNGLESGLKSKVINRALRQYKETINSADVLGKDGGTLGPQHSQTGTYPSSLQPRSELAELAEWLKVREKEKGRRYQIVDQENTKINIVKLLNIFAKRNSGRADRVLAEYDGEE